MNKKLYLKEILSNTILGEIGTATPYKDNNGEQLFVGDIINIDSEEVCVDAVMVEIDNDQFISGIRSNCNSKTGKIKDWKVIKIKSYKDLKVGDKFNDGFILFKVIEQSNTKRKITLEDCEQLRVKFKEYFLNLERKGFWEYLIFNMMNKTIYNLKRDNDIEQDEVQEVLRAMFRTILSAMGEDCSMYKEGV